MPEFAKRFRVCRPDRRGHGRTADIDGPITYDVMADETIAFLEQVVGGPAYLLGHSVKPGAGHGELDTRIVIDFLTAPR